MASPTDSVAADRQDRSVLAYPEEVHHPDQDHVDGCTWNQRLGTLSHAQNAFFILLLAAWGCVGITQQSFGFHNVWEFWAYQAFYGIFVCPWYAVSVSPHLLRARGALTVQQAMISEVVPRGKEVRSDGEVSRFP